MNDVTRVSWPVTRASSHESSATSEFSAGEKQDDKEIAGRLLHDRLRFFPRNTGRGTRGTPH